jgi:hypothetical protein
MVGVKYDIATDQELLQVILKFEKKGYRNFFLKRKEGSEKIWIIKTWK